MREYVVYILASKSGVLDIGVTNDLSRRLFEHRQKLVLGFTGKYYDPWAEIPRQARDDRTRCHTFRHFFATHLLESGSDWRSPLDVA